MKDKTVKNKAVKDRIINILLVVALILGITLPVALVVIPREYPAIKGNPIQLYTPKFVTVALLGQPSEVTTDSLTGQDTFIYKNKKIFSYKGTISYTYEPWVREINADFVVDDRDPIDVYKEIRDYMYNHYSKQRGFFDEYENSSDEEKTYSCSFGHVIDELNTIQAFISLKGNNISICVYRWR